MLALWSWGTEVTRGEGWQDLGLFWHRDSEMSDAESLCDSEQDQSEALCLFMECTSAAVSTQNWSQLLRFSWKTKD